MLTKKLFRTAFHYKAQFISMIIMITLGVGIFLGFNIEWKSIEEDTSRFFEQTNYADFRLYSDTGFSKEDVRAIQKIDNVQAATRFLNTNVEIKGKEQTLSLNVSEDNNVSTMYITKGEKYTADSDGIWLSDKFAEANNIHIGDTLTLIYQGIEISGKIVGLAKSSEHMICVADENQLMPDYHSFGFAYITPDKLEKSLGTAFYPQVNVISPISKATLETKVKETLGTTILLVSKENHTAYAGAESEMEEGKTMGSILPVLFLAIAILTMVTTMHRIAANEKVQIGTLKALGFRDRKILLHYTSYGFFIGITGSVIGIALAYLIAALIMSPKGMMATYFDLPKWNLVMPSFCIPVMILTVIFLTFISYCSVKKMLKGTAADALHPYTPKNVKQSILERLPFIEHSSFSVKWNLRDILRHKARSGMTLIGILGCMILLVGGLGMKDTIENFLSLMDNDIYNYVTKINLVESSTNKEVKTLAHSLNADWQSSTGISYNGNTTTLEVFHTPNDKLHFLTEDNVPLTIEDDGVYLCQRLKNSAKIGDTISFSPYDSDKTYQVKVAGYFRSLVTESIIMTDTYADKLGIEYHISSLYTDTSPEKIENSDIISGKQQKQALMDSYNSLMELLNLMIVILIVAAIILGIVVLYNLGIMSYVERRRELATLKVLGFQDKAISHLLISQNIWLTIIGIVLGIPSGIGVLYFLITELASEYELSLTLGILTYSVSILLTFFVSLIVSFAVAQKNKKIDMVEALKDRD